MASQSGTAIVIVKLIVKRKRYLKGKKKTTKKEKWTNDRFGGPHVMLSNTRTIQKQCKGREQPGNYLQGGWNKQL